MFNKERKKERKRNEKLLSYCLHDLGPLIWIMMIVYYDDFHADFGFPDIELKLKN
jgi:hypothetical protein